MRWCNVQTNEYDLQGKTYPIGVARNWQILSIKWLTRGDPHIIHQWIGSSLVQKKDIFTLLGQSKFKTNRAFLLAGSLGKNVMEKSKSQCENSFWRIRILKILLAKWLTLNPFSCDYSGTQSSRWYNKFGIISLNESYMAAFCWFYADLR